MQPNHGSADPRLAPSASWLYWVAALSAINTIIQLSGGKWSFSMGLGLTRALDEAGTMFGALATTIAIAASAVMVAILCLLGYMACRGAVWAFVAGIVVLSLDTLLLVPFASTQWLSIAFHIWAIVSLVGGLNTARGIQSGGGY